MSVYLSRNALAAEQFIHKVLNYCEGEPWKIWAYNAETFRR